MIDPIERALTYPYAAPVQSYLFAEGRAQPYQPPSAMTERRVPIIGYGSNRSPEQLARKYPETGQQIPVETAWLDGFDGVYSARIGGYAAIPATVAPCPGCCLPVVLTWLSSDQLPAMHASEGIGVAYDFGVLEVPVRGEHSGLLPRALIYVNRTGAYAPEGEPVALAEIESEGRCWQSAGQHEIQSSLAAFLQTGASAEAFVEANLADKQVRLARSRQMAAQAVAWHHPAFRPLSPEDKL